MASKEPINAEAALELMEISIRNLLKAGLSETQVRRMVEAELNRSRNG